MEGQESRKNAKIQVLDYDTINVPSFSFDYHSPFKEKGIIFWCCMMSVDTRE